MCLDEVLVFSLPPLKLHTYLFSNFCYLTLVFISKLSTVYEPFVLATLVTLIHFLVTYPAISATIFVILLSIAMVGIIWYWLFTFFGG
jgi:hypothetical protein